MRRDEAFAKATEAVSKFSIMRKEAWDEHSGSRPSPPADWLHPTVHQLIAALEAIGVVKFDQEEPACPFKLGDPVRFICGGKSQGRVEIVLNRWNVRTSNGNYHAVNTLELDEPLCPFGVGDLVRSIYGDLMQTVVVIEETREGSWLITTNKSTTKWNVHELLLVKKADAEPKAARRIHRVPTANQNAAYDAADIYEDTLVETVRMIGYAVVRKEKPPKLPETAYMLCGCAESEFCPQGGVGPRQRCKIPISRNKRWVLERALRVLNGEN